jgi:hypothetical protein
MVKEALRLYPPTRRANRVFYGQNMDANIEECQRFILLGSRDACDALVFRPERWRSICKKEGSTKHIGEEDHNNNLSCAEAEVDFMPFASTCPAGGSATRGFGLKMIGLLVAVLCASIDDD